jgi:hypothetical protein
MRFVRFASTALLVISLSGAPAFAGELRDSIAAAADNAAAAGTAASTEAQETPMHMPRSGKAMFWGGTALFAGGMAYGLFDFINNKNGSFSEFGEATATNKKAGAAGLSLAFAGGALMLLGHHSERLPSLSVGAHAVGVAKKVSW